MATSPPLQHPASDTTVFLDQPPSCLQFCPAIPDCCIIGTYLLSEQKDESNDSNIKQTKTGSLQLWRIDPSTKQLTFLWKHPLPYAVFDLHFHPRDASLLSIATSAGSVAFFRLTPDEHNRTPTLTPLLTQSVHEDPSIPALFLAWTPSTWPSPTPNGTTTTTPLDAFAVTFSDSRTTIFQYTPGPSAHAPPKITELDTFPASQAIEVWFAALATFPESTSKQEIPYIFTGNDFGALHTRRYTITSETNHLSVLLDHHDRARHHTAGVTSILPLPLPLKDDSPVILTGSYDESLRVYHATRRGEVLAEIGLGGGVWRLQLLSASSSAEAEEEWTGLVLASCMHGGTRVVRVRCSGGSEWELEVLAEFTEHESMNYATDVWRPAGGYELPIHSSDEQQEVLCLSSSFYDRRVCLWRVRV
ncbi:uncharacterized protein BO97DRAFT_393252 [Aspergillus homomorphus CBS 101889]|uniref:WD40 repeat-like protein n=1 Tax=Aspergillus homomorphus (strain CBS 101889) TaxID=1450537 RepID=A0A395HVD8_ASPHC|nr:hypothetical protein BO97DRAFT_393252 [Aspergillus homomorphus CBS 101889]RAL10808.1 hypothetical protein BO97DRAFT_393252 [Aspergillus homomorphus CBS 101889]